MRKKLKQIQRITFLQALIPGVLLCGAGGLQAAEYQIFVQGLDPVKGHCNSTRNANWGKADVGAYWFGLVPDNVDRRIFVGFNTTASDGAFSNSTCGAQAELTYAMNKFCKRGENTCKIYTHSTGGLVMTYFLKQLQDINFFKRPKYGIQNIRLMANASGGSELADATSWYVYNSTTKAWEKKRSGLSTVQNSVRTTIARTRFDHNRTNGYLLQLTGGTGKILGISIFLPGENDSVVANHSLCGMRFIGSYKKCRDGLRDVEFERESIRCDGDTLFDNEYHWLCTRTQRYSSRFAEKWDNHSVYNSAQNDSDNHVAAMLEYLETNAERQAAKNNLHRLNPIKYIARRLLQNSEELTVTGECNGCPNGSGLGNDVIN